MAAPLSSTDSLVPPLRRRPRRLVFDSRYGWIFDEWTDPADQALSGGRGMFCAVTMARSLVSAAASSINYAASSISRVLEHPKRLPLPAHMSTLAFRKKQQAWFRELECSGVVADLNKNPAFGAVKMKRRPSALGNFASHHKSEWKNGNINSHHY